MSADYMAPEGEPSKSRAMEAVEQLLLRRLPNVYLDDPEMRRAVQKLVRAAHQRVSTRQLFHADIRVKPVGRLGRIACQSRARHRAQAGSCNTGGTTHCPRHLGV